jgi:hypothetical protein
MNQDEISLVEELETIPFDIFKSFMVFMPMCNQGHRQLVVLINPGRVVGYGTPSNTSTAMMLILNPSVSKSHIDNTAFARRIRSWLNRIYKSRSDSDDSMRFSADNFGVYTLEGEHRQPNLIQLYVYFLPYSHIIPFLYRPTSATTTFTS